MKINKIVVVLFALVVSTLFASCSKREAVLDGETESVISETNKVISAVPNMTSVTLAKGNIKTIIYDELDLEPGYDDFAALSIDLNDLNSLKGVSPDVAQFIDGDLELSTGGIYILKGDLRDGQIRIRKTTGERVLLVLNGVNINTSKQNAILSQDKCKVLLRVEDGSSNYITSSGSFVDPAIFTKGSLTLTGNGNLKVDGSCLAAIECKDVLTILSGNYDFNVEKDAIKGKNGVIIRDARINIKSGDEAIKSSDNENGFMFIEGGIFNIIASGKGLSADREMVITGGEFNIESVGECLEAYTIDITGGDFKLKSTNDGMNASDKSQYKKDSQEGTYIRIAGGSLFIDTELDGIDSNGDLYVEGGKIYISGPASDYERIIDYNGVALLSGGEMIAIGPYAKMQDFGENSAQNHIVVYYDNIRTKDKVFEVRDDKDTILLSLNPTKDYKAAIVTSEVLKEGKTYKIISGDRVDVIEVKKGRTEVR